MSELPKIEAAIMDANNESDIELIDLLIIWAKRKKFIIGFTLLFGVFGLVSSLRMPNIYEATIRILPPQQAQSNAAALMAQLGGIAGGMAAGLAKNSNDIYIAMIKSRTLADAMVDRFALLSVYDVKRREQARRQLEENTRVLNGKDGIITVDVSDSDPKLASMIANAYGDELLKMTRSIAVTQASQTRLFFERQLKISREKLAEEEEKLKEHLQKNGVISVDSDSRALMEMAAKLRAQVAGKEIQVAAMKPFVTEQNADYKRHVQELLSTKEELRKLENGPGSTKTEGGSPSSNDGLGSMQLLRDVKYHQMLYEVLSKQYEASRLEEARDVAIIQILDSALVPETKIGPRRLYITLAYTFSAFIFALLITLMFEFAEGLKRHPETQRKLSMLKEYIVGSRRI